MRGWRPPSEGEPGGGIPSVDILGVEVSAITMADALQAVDRWVATRDPHYVCVTGVHGIMESRRDESLRDIHNHAGMVTPDGMPLVWLSRLKGHSHVSRVYGPDLLLACCRHSISRGYSHYFYGGGETVPERLAERLCQRFPGLRVAGTLSPPFRALSPEEDDQTVTRINDAAPDIVWVGLSTPKQERWMSDHLTRVRAPVMIGIGAAFDFHAGLKRQAPLWMQRSGLEWLFRLGSEPKRLWRRYLVNNPLFVWHVAREALGKSRPRDREPFTA